MAIIAVSAPRGARFSCFNTNPLPQLPIPSRRSSKLNFRSKGFTPFARYAQTQQDLFSSRLQDSIENLPKLVEDIVQTSINTGPRGALRLAQGVQAFLGGGGEWLADVSKDVDVMAFAKDLDKIFSSIQDLDTELIVATARDTTTNATAVSANAVVDERQLNALFLDVKVSEVFGKGNYKYLELDGEAQSWKNQRMVVARGKANSERNGVDFDSDEENGNGGGGGDQEPFDWEKEMRKRVKEIEERRELVKKAEELQNRIFDDNSQEEKEESEEEKKERVRKELEKVAMEQAERRKTAELMFELGQKAYGKGMYVRAIEFLEASLTIIPRSTLFGGEIQIWLAMAYEANNRHADCIALYKQLEMKHPSISIRRQAANLRYILQAPKLKISQEEMVTIPLIGSTYDSYAASWSDKYKEKDQERSWTTSNQLPSSRDFMGDFLVWRPPTGLEKNREGSESQPTLVAPRSSSLARSASTTKAASRLSVSQSESYHSSRPARSSSVTRPSISSSQYSTYSSNRSSSILNTSSASVSSYTRPSSPVSRTPSIARPSTPSARPTPSRSSTPSRARPAPTSSSIDKTRPSQNSRPSTPSSRGQIPANLSTAPTRSNSRPSTPTRRNPAPSSSTASSPSTSAGRVLSNNRIPGPTSRPNSPSPRVRPQQPVVPPDFPLDTPPNLRTTLPDRPLSAGRSRPNVHATMKGNPETVGSVIAPRRHSSPIVSRGRLTEPSGKGRVHSNGHIADAPEPRKVSHVSELGMRKPVKSSSTASESTGFGRTISKKSLDMAIRHMDLRNGTGSTRSLSSTTLFPQSIRSATPKTHPARSRSAPESINNGNLQNGDVLENESYFSRATEIRREANDGQRYSAKLSEVVDICESSRYDAILLKEDLKNTDWLHSVDDKSDQGPFFDNGFEPLPEPFGLL